MIVSVSFAFLVTVSLLLAMNQLFCVAAVPSDKRAGRPVRLHGGRAQSIGTA